jgi:hypothetical protein
VLQQRTYDVQVAVLTGDVQRRGTVFDLRQVHQGPSVEQGLHYLGVSVVAGDVKW